MTNLETTTQLETTTLGAGCFWCIEAIYQDVKGVHSVVSGYMGGHVRNPNYEEVCNGTTGHAEVAQITFDPSIISFEDILYIFWQTHDSTTLNRQGNDVGTQYRSAIFYHDDNQKQIAEVSKTEAAKLFSAPIVTEITPASEFYKAELYHQNFYKLNPNQPYCRYMVDPKVKKFRKSFADKLQVA
jgi:peptide-methionine (S)-S-oxide reductase